ncbi:MAG: hypothetical protein ACI4XM_04965 [Candidatus Coprovivens sp.]
MNNEIRDKKIISYVDLLINELNGKYPNMDFNNVRNNAISTFLKMSGSFEDIKTMIDEAFVNAVQKMKASEEAVQSISNSFEMTPEEEAVYQQLKQDSLVKRNNLGLNNSKKLVLKNDNSFNNGYISFLIVLIVVLVVVVSLIVIICNVLF